MPDRSRQINFGIGVGVVTVITAVIVVVLILRTGGSESPKPSITVEEVINRVDTDRPRQEGVQPTNFVSARVGQELISGDGVLTFQNSEARVDITVQEFLRVIRTTPNTLWRLGQFQEDQGAIVELDQGKIFLLDRGDKDSPFPVRVVTPAGTGSPRGTWMSVSYDPTSKTVEVECFRGTCQLENPLGRQLLKDQQKSGATVETAPTEPLYLDPLEVLDFQGLPEAKSGEISIPALAAVLPTLTPTPTPTPTPTLEPSPTDTPTHESTPPPTATPSRPSTPVPTATPLYKLPEIPDLPDIPGSCGISLQYAQPLMGSGNALLLLAPLAMIAAFRRFRS